MDKKINKGAVFRVKGGVEGVGKKEGKGGVYEVGKGQRPKVKGGGDSLFFLAILDNLLVRLDMAKRVASSPEQRGMVRKIQGELKSLIDGEVRMQKGKQRRREEKREDERVEEEVAKKKQVREMMERDRWLSGRNE